MASMHWSGTLLATALTVAGLSSCCGTVSETHYRYDRITPGSLDPEQDYYWLAIEPTRTVDREGLLDTDTLEAAPYRLELAAYAYQAYTEPARILEAKVEHQGQVVFTLGRDETPAEASLVEDYGTRWMARAQLPLGDSLTYVDGSTVKVWAVVELPWEDDEVTIEQEYGTDYDTWSASRLEIMMGV